MAWNLIPVTLWCICYWASYIGAQRQLMDSPDEHVGCFVDSATNERVASPYAYD